jgi:predicted ribosomally synthesized peptide with SipW-like signal peptide
MRAPLKIAVASVAAAALLGGGSLAFWTDQGSINDRALGSGELSLEVGQTNVGNRFLKTNLYPGGSDTRTVAVTSNDAGSTPDANLYLSLAGVEESNAGAFADDLDVRIRAQKRAEGCGTNINGGEWTMDLYDGSLRDLIDAGYVAYPAENGATGALVLEPGERVCTIAAASLPFDSNNDSQNALVEFDLQFDLVQVGGSPQS